MRKPCAAISAVIAGVLLALSFGVPNASFAEDSAPQPAFDENGVIIPDGEATAGSSLKSDIATYSLAQRQTYGTSWRSAGSQKAFYDGQGNLFASPALKVIDISQWQGTIDWNKVKNSGIDGVIMRVGWSSGGLDPQFERNLSEVRRLGIPYGVYLFSYAANAQDAQAEADWTKALVDRYGLYDMSFPIFYDLETGKSNDVVVTPTSRAVYEQVINSYFSRLAGYGISNVSIYTGRWYYQTYFANTANAYRVSWIAEYGSRLQTSFPCSGQYGWQYTSTEYVDGITANTVDMSAFSDANFINVMNLPAYSIADGTYYIDSIANDALGVTVADNGSLILASAADAPSQRFSFESATDGSYRIKNEASGLYLTVDGSVAQNGSAVVQSAISDSDAQRWYLRNGDNGFYIQSALGNWVLDLAGGSTADGTSVRIYSPNKTNAQRFAFAAPSSVKENTSFIIQSKLNPSLVMDIYGGSSENRARLQIYNANKSDAQLFAFHKVGNGLYEIVNAKSGKPFESEGGSVANGGKVSQYASNGTVAQHWSVIEHADGAYSFINAKSGKAIDVPGANGASGTGLQIYSYNASDAQKWTLTSGKSTRERLNDLARENLDSVASSTIYAIGTSSERQVLDVSGGSTASGANVQVYGSNATDAQRWTFSYDSKGYATITNAKSGRVLDVSGGSKSAGTNVQQYASNGSWAQKWIIVPCDNGTYKICSALDENLVLDLSGGSTSDCANVQVYSDNGTAAQRFRLYTSFEAAKGRSVDDRTAVLQSSNGLVADVTGGSDANGAAIQLYSANGTIAQSFGIEFDESKGLYTLKAANSYRYLYAQNGDFVPGAQIRQGSNTTANDLSYYWSISQSNDGGLLIANAASGLVIGVSSSNKLVTVAPGDARALTFSLLSSSFGCLRSEQDASAASGASLVEDGSYYLSSSLDYGKVLDVSGGSKDNSANVQLYASNKTAAQQWTLTRDDKGYVTFSNVGSGKVLDVAGGVASQGRNIAQYAPNGTYAQKWIVHRLAGGLYSFESAIRPGFYLSVSGNKAGNGSNIELSTNGGALGSQCALLSLAPKVSPCEDILPKGYYNLAPASSALGKVLDVAGGKSSCGTNVQLYGSNGTFAQLFYFEYRDGYYVIRCGKNDMALDVAGGGVVPGTNVQIWTAVTGEANQLFAAQDNGDGSFTFINKATGLALDIVGGSDSNGTNLDAYLPNGTVAQKFSLKPVSEFIAPGAYSIKSAVSQKVLDVAGGSTADGAAVQLYDSNGTLAQKWYVSKVDGVQNTFEIECIGSGKLLSVNESGALVQTANNGSDAQRWHSGLSHGHVVLINAQTGSCLAASGSSYTLGMVDSDDLPGVGFDFATVGVLSEGTYTIQLMGNKSRVLDVSGGSTTAGASVGLYGDNGTAAQIWDVRENSDGTYEISSAKSSKPLDILNGSLSAGNSLQIWTRNTSNAQKWNIVYKKGEGYAITTANGLVLGDFDGRLCLGEDGRSSSQRFAFEKTTYVPPILTGVQWKGALHYSSSRFGEDWSVIVIHISECNSLSQIDNTFWGSREASAHYGVAPGQVHQYVGLNDTAWAVGDWEWNKRTVSIEHVGTTANPPSYATLDTSAQLMAALARSKGWRRLTLGDNVGIHKWYSSTSCPAGTDVNWLVARANVYLGN